MLPREKNKNALALLALAISAFAIGTTEFISVGLLPLIADDLHITVTTAGLTVTLYALGVMFGAPVLTTLTSGISRKTLLIGIMILFIIGNGLAATASGIAMLLAARVLSALAHGIFMSIGSTIAAGLVAEDRKASAISVMFSGLTIATVTGVPVGTYLGQLLGWRFAFWAIAAVGAVALFANLALVPGRLRSSAKPSLRDSAKLVTNVRFLLIFAITALGYGGTFTVFTYLSPLLHEVTGYSEKAVAAILLVYGIAIAIGNTVGGKLANRNPLRVLFYMFMAQAAVLVLLAFTAPYRTAGLANVFFMGLLAFMNVPGLQVHAVTLAEKIAPKSVDLASALNISAFNAGIALGAYVGGIVTDSIGLVHTAWAGAIMVAAAVALTAWSRRLEAADSSFRQTGTGADRTGASSSQTARLQ